MQRENLVVAQRSPTTTRKILEAEFTYTKRELDGFSLLFEKFKV
jgi:hypothetical protein